MEIFEKMFPELKGRGRTLALLLGLALFVRLPLWLASPGAAFDLESYRLTAHSLWHGHLYRQAGLGGRYPYLPLWALCLLPLTGLSRILRLPPALLFKIPGLLGDLGLVFLIYRMAHRLEEDPSRGLPPRPLESPAFWSALAYAANPVAILITAGHGQFDSLPVLFLLLAAYFFEFSKSPFSDRWSALSLAAAVGLKSWPAFFLPLFLKNLPLRRQRLVFLAWVFLPLALLSLPFFLHEPGAMLRSLSYHGATALSLPETLHAAAYLAGWKPVTYSLLSGLWSGSTLVCLAGLWVAFLSSRRSLPVLPGLLLGSLTLYVFAPAFSVQYLLWLLPPALLVSGGAALRQTLYGLMMLCFFYLVFLPGAVMAVPGPGASRLLVGAWAVLNAGLWVFWLTEWKDMASGWGLFRKATTGA
jgi:hypothetical protein